MKNSLSKKPDAPSKRVPKLRFFRDEKKEWRCTSKGGNGEELMMTTEGYKNRKDCEHAVLVTETAINLWRRSNK
jgi:uncharacterized protein YegP (UPF0339 family)